MSETPDHNTLSGSPSGSAEAPRTECESRDSHPEKKTSDTDVSPVSISDEMVHAVRVACKELVTVSGSLADLPVSHTMKHALNVAAAREVGDMLIRKITEEIKSKENKK